MTDARRQLLEFYQCGIKAVEGRHAVAQALKGAEYQHSPYLVALGKAAASMLQGALDVLGDGFAQALMITKYDHGDEALAHHPRITCFESAHPYPDQNSLLAGERLIAFLQQAPADAEFLFLISGGASALVESLPDGVTLADLERVSHWLLASGLPIDQMNQIRKGLSRIKGGRLLSYLAGRQGRCLLISDVLGDDMAVIGSGPLLASVGIEDGLYRQLPDWLQEMLSLAQQFKPSQTNNVLPHQIVANNQIALDRITDQAESQGLVIHRYPMLEGDALEAGEHIAEIVLNGLPGIHLWGGEATVQLPDNPGRGGRCQALALAAAKVLAGRQGVYLLAAGSDGTDGPGEDAGALVDGLTIERGEQEGLSAEDCLARADAGSFLAESGDLIQTGPTGTNVMDLVIVHKLSGNF